jgi:hypothetical protein
VTKRSESDGLEAWSHLDRSNERHSRKIIKAGFSARHLGELRVLSSCVDNLFRFWQCVVERMKPHEFYFLDPRLVTMSGGRENIVGEADSPTIDGITSQTSYNYGTVGIAIGESVRMARH